MRQTRAVHLALKTLLRRHGLTYADVADVLGVAESSVKRLFATYRLSLDRIEQICNAMSLDFTDLLEQSQHEEPRLTRLSEAQEAQLLEEPRLFLVAYMLLNHWSLEEITEAFDFNESAMVRMLARLDRMGLIELLPGNRVRLLTARNFSWNPNGPVTAYLGRVVFREFLQSRFAGPGEKMEFVSGMLSRAGVLEVHQMIDELTRRFDDLIFRDIRLPAAERFGVSLLACIRPWEFSRFAEFRRGPNTKTF